MKPWRLRLEAWVPVLPFVLVIGLAAARSLLLPVAGRDADAWLHLALGRYITEHGQLPVDSFFSFLAPARALVDLPWLFQVLIYRLHAWWGSAGLILFRAGMTFVLLLLMARYLLDGRRSRPQHLALTLVFVISALVVVPRLSLIRPHLASYALLMAAVVVLEGPARRFWWLPVIALLEANLHGWAYPVLWLVIGAYVIERLAGRGGQGAANGSFDALLLPAAASCLATLASPHGFRLLPLPFQGSSLSVSIAEFTPPSLDLLLGSQPLVLQPMVGVLLGALLLLTLFAAAALINQGALRISHAILLAGGVYLLSRGIRFMNEYALLALPLLKTVVLRGPARPPQAVPRWRGVVGAAAATAVACTFLLANPVMLLSHPPTSRLLPEGIARFLRYAQATGNVLNDPDPGGYFLWSVYPRQKISTILMAPGLFSNEDFYTGVQASANPAVLKKLLDQYPVPFICVPRHRRGFPELIRAFPSYRLVFFDDTSALYAAADQQPEIAAAHAITSIDPFAFSPEDPREVLSLSMPEAEAETMRGELMRILAIDPESGLGNSLAAALEIQSGDGARAAEHARQVLAHFPEWSVACQLRAEAATKLGDDGSAGHWYMLAAQRAGAADQPALAARAVTAYLRAGRPREAHAAFRSVVPRLFDPGAFSYEDLYWFGMASVKAGHLQDAELALRCAEWVVPADRADWRAKISDALAGL